MNNFAGVRRQVKALSFCCDVIKAGTAGSGDVTKVWGSDGDVDWFVQVQVDSNETLEHVRVRSLTRQTTHHSKRAFWLYTVPLCNACIKLSDITNHVTVDFVMATAILATLKILTD